MSASADLCQIALIVPRWQNPDRALITQSPQQRLFFTKAGWHPVDGAQMRCNRGQEDGLHMRAKGGLNKNVDVNVGVSCIFLI